jgi:hypothetical protein
LRDHHVEENLRVAEEIFEAVGTVDIEADEDKTLVAVDPGFLQAACGLVEAFVIFTRCLDLDQAAITFVAPGVEGAGKG